jgi:hypothetical protein
MLEGVRKMQRKNPSANASMQEILSRLVERCADPEILAALTAGDHHSMLHPSWTAQRFAFGNAAVALFFGQLDRYWPQQGFDMYAHQHLLTLFPEAKWSSPDTSLFSGLSGACALTWSLSRQGERYTQLLTSLETSLFEQLHERYQALLEAPERFTLSDYDLILGAAGHGVYLLMRLPDPRAKNLLDLLLHTLIAIVADSLERYSHPLFLSPKVAHTSLHKHYPQGYAICGIAHGVAGLILLFAYSLRFGAGTLHLSETLDHLCQWILIHMRQGDAGITWPSYVGPDLFHEDTRDSWCYGTPGIAWAIWQAGQIRANSLFQETALAAIKAVCERLDAQQGLPFAGLCHGVGGLYHILRCFAQEHPNPWLEKAIAHNQDRLIALFDPSLTFGFQDHYRNTLWDHPGFLSGAIGAVLALLAGQQETPVIWDRWLLLSGGPLSGGLQS